MSESFSSKESVPRPNISSEIVFNEDGTASAYELGTSMKIEGDEIIQNDPDAKLILDVITKIKSPDAKQSMQDDLVKYLRKEYPEFNWKTYFELIKEEKPTLN